MVLPPSVLRGWAKASSSSEEKLARRGPRSGMISLSGSIAWARTQRWGRVRRGRTGGAAARTVCACRFRGREKQAARGQGTKLNTKKCHSLSLRRKRAQAERVWTWWTARRARARARGRRPSLRAHARAPGIRPRPAPATPQRPLPTPSTATGEGRGGACAGVVRAGARLRPRSFQAAQGRRGSRFFLWRRRAARLAAHSRHARD